MPVVGCYFQALDGDKNDEAGRSSRLCIDHMYALDQFCRRKGSLSNLVFVANEFEKVFLRLVEFKLLNEYAEYAPQSFALSCLGVNYRCRKSSLFDRATR
jgi:hypothetical protein